ncbi:MFS transporter [Lactonifactor longoviformis]|uniref:Predicted arabinose efflux permease, MFS family n=1 Tax=Lactonifactor longoviformis DSM 17459 TaxID=1122155 RepID=A0A1M4ZVM4_9CLOT|nr:MFS transporter [Lactonifactor longoviformis]POP32449.1 MFS transporter [Lactonifactor longoviformis]SHF22069.1 Predicted arabinose efflux permease, MFS family [Lactonifactor longoviformis DSM 17459]
MRKMGFKKLMIFIILSATVALAYQIPYLRFTFYDQMTAALNLTDTQMGLMATAVSLTSTLCYPIGGIFAEKFSCRNLIIISLAGLAACTVVYSMTTNFVVLMIVHILYGFFGIATLWSAYLTGIRSLGDEESQSTLFGSSEATRGIIQAVGGFLFLGIMGAAASAASGFRFVLLAGMVICVLFLILAFIFLPKGELNGEDIVNDSETSYTMLDALKCKGVWITIGLVACAFVSWTLGNGYLTTYTVRVLGVAESTASTLGIIRSYIIVFLAGFIGGWLLDKFTFKGKGFFVLFTAVIAATAAMMLTSKVVPVCIVITMILAFIANIMKSTYWSTMGQAGIPMKMTAVATGVVSFIAFIPDFIVPTVAGVWLDEATKAGNVAAGFHKIFILLFVFSAAGLVISVILTKQAKSIKGQE